MSPMTAGVTSAQAARVCAVEQALAWIARPRTDIQDAFISLIALVPPIRLRVQGVVDRRFYRRRYDAIQILTQLTARLRDRRDPDASAGDIRRVVDMTVPPAYVLLRLVPGRAA